MRDFPATAVLVLTMLSDDALVADAIAGRCPRLPAQDRGPARDRTGAARGRGRARRSSPSAVASHVLRRVGAQRPFPVRPVGPGAGDPRGPRHRRRQRRDRGPALYLSQKTVANHLSAIFQKLGAVSPGSRGDRDRPRRGPWPRWLTGPRIGLSAPPALTACGARRSPRPSHRDVRPGPGRLPRLGRRGGQLHAHEPGHRPRFPAARARPDPLVRAAQPGSRRCSSLSGLGAPAQQCGGHDDDLVRARARLARPGAAPPR